MSDVLREDESVYDARVGLGAARVSGQLLDLDVGADVHAVVVVLHVRTHQVNTLRG